jgi:hypothetical protein
MRRGERVRRPNELYYLFRVVPLLEFMAGVRRRGCKELWLTRTRREAYLRTPDGEQVHRPYRLIHHKAARVGPYSEVDIVDLCSKPVHRLFQQARRVELDPKARIELVVNPGLDSSCWVFIQGYSERVGPWDLEASA